MEEKIKEAAAVANQAMFDYLDKHIYTASQFTLCEILRKNSPPYLLEAEAKGQIRVICSSDYDTPHYEIVYH